MNYKNLDIYDELFKDYQSYIKDNINYEIKIAKKAPQSITKFPTIIMKEVINTNTNNISTNYQEFVDLVGYQVDIYTKDFIDENGQHYSMEVQKELKQLTYNFFFANRFKRQSYEDWENNNLIYDRLTLVFQGNLQSWNKQIV